jgi:sugar lactone lactonase YvrE
MRQAAVEQARWEAGGVRFRIDNVEPVQPLTPAAGRWARGDRTNKRARRMSVETERGRLRFRASRLSSSLVRPANRRLYWPATRPIGGAEDLDTRGPSPGVGRAAHSDRGDSLTYRSTTRAATAAMLLFASATASARGGLLLYATDEASDSVVQVDDAGNASTFAGGITDPYGLALDPVSGLYVAAKGGVIRKVSATGVVTTFATGLPNIFGLAADRSGNLYATSIANNTLTKVTPDGAFGTFAAGFNNPSGVTVGPDGNIYVCEYGDGIIRRVTPGGAVSTFATVPGSAHGMAFDRAGTLYVTSNGSTVSKVSPAGVVTQVAMVPGSGQGVAFDPAGNLFVLTYSSGIYQVTPTGTVTRFSSGLAGAWFLASPVPEPTAAGLLATAAAGLLARRRRPATRG